MDKVAMYKGEIYKIAEEKSVEKTIKTQSPKRKLRDIAKNRDQFKGKIKSNIRPMFSESDDVAYRTLHTGAGRRNQSLEAERYHPDYNRIDLKDESPEEYKDRLSENIIRAKLDKRKATRRGIAAGLGAAGLGMGAGLGLGVKAGDIASGANIGSVIGLSSGILTGSAVKKKLSDNADKNFLKRLKEHEKEKLKELRGEDAKKVSEDTGNAHLLTAKNIYAY